MTPDHNGTADGKATEPEAFVLAVLTANAVFMAPLVFDALRLGMVVEGVLFLVAFVPLALAVVAPVIAGPFLLVRRLLLTRTPVRCEAAIGAGAALGAAFTLLVALVLLGHRSAWDIRYLTLLAALAGGSGGWVYWCMIWRQGPSAPKGAA